MAHPPQPASSNRHVRRPRLNPAVLAGVQDALLAWFAEHGRDLPWRRTRDPWAILVSEVMLQQIQVVRAVPFYHAFLARFPTVQDLAAAPLAEAIRVWGDLGRYRRVVSLHRTARIVVDQHGGAIPADVEALRHLPGVGPYTAGAVACFAFERDAPVVDTNIRRVLHRVFVGVELPAPRIPDRAIDLIATAAVPAGRGWDWNQGLMDFGATLCTARRPACDRCPVRVHCRAEGKIAAAIARVRQRRDRSGPVYRYEESNLYYRGRVLAQLRQRATGDTGAEGIALRDLGGELRPGFSDADLPWLAGVVDSLARDGLAIAEERPVYDVGQPEAAPDREVWVKLPD